MLVIGGCSKNGCTDPTADNYDPDAVTNSGCIPARDKFIGDYSVQTQCSDTAYAYALSIIADPDEDRDVIIQNFGDYNVPVNAIINGSLIEITEDTYGNKIISGNGEISGYTLVIHYLAVDIITNDSTGCTFTAIK